MEIIQFTGFTPDAFRAMIREEMSMAMAASMQKEKKYYSRNDVAEMLQVSLPTVHRLVNDGLLKASKVGGRTLFDAEAVDAAIVEKKVFRYKHRN